MSEQVSLDFLISLKQATQNITQTRKIGGALDYLANLAKKANDALFKTSEGEDANEKYIKGAKKTQNATSITAGLMEAASKTTRKALDLTVMGVRASVGWWADHAGAMVVFRKEMGYTSEQVHQFSMGVTRSAAQYGTSMRTVRDLTFFMARGAKLGTKEIGKLAGAMADLADFGGVNTATVKDFMVVMSGWNQIKSKEGAAQMALGIKAVAQEFKVSANGILQGFVGINNLLPMLSTNVEGAHEMLTGMFASAESFGHDAGDMAEIVNSMFTAGSRAHGLLISNNGDLKATMSIIMGQVKTLMTEYTDEHGKMGAQAKAAMLRMGSVFNMEQLTQLRGMVLGYDDALKNASKIHKFFGMSMKDLRKQITDNLTPLELVHQKIKQIKASASGFWESFMGGTGGKMLFSALDKIEAALQAWEAAFGDPDKEKDKSEKAKKLLVQTKMAAINPLNTDLPMGPLGLVLRTMLYKAATPEAAARAAHKGERGLTQSRRGANELLAKFAAPGMETGNLEATRLRAELGKATTGPEIRQILLQLVSLVIETKKANTEREKQGQKIKGNNLSSAAALAGSKTR